MQKQSKAYSAETLSQILRDLEIRIPPALGGPDRLMRPIFSAPMLVTDGDQYRVVGSAALVATIDAAATAEREYRKRHALAQSLEYGADEWYGDALEKFQAELRARAGTGNPVLMAH